MNDADARILAREHDALANMAGTEARRVDSIVHDVGAIKGDVRGLKSDTARIGAGVDELKHSMALVGRHAVLMETQSAEITAVRLEQRQHDARLRELERDVPPLIEAREWMTRGVLVVLGMVGLAVLGVVLKGGLT